MGGVWATSFVTIATARGTVQVSTAKVTEPQDRQNFIVTIVSMENKCCEDYSFFTSGR